jgi:hypothetical protein
MKLWKHNRTDMEYELTDKELIDNFLLSQYFRDWKTGIAFNLDRNFLLWVTMPEPDGIDTYIEKEDCDRILNLIHKDPRRNAK